MTIYGNHDPQKKCDMQKKACTCPVVKSDMSKTLLSWTKFCKRSLRSIFFICAWYQDNKGKQISGWVKAFSSELKKILKEKDSKCSARPKPAYTEENTSGDQCISKGTVNIRVVEKDGPSALWPYCRPGD